jgi:1,4-alpha-glucan branching enzyme
MGMGGRLGCGDCARWLGDALRPSGGEEDKDGMSDNLKDQLAGNRAQPYSLLGEQDLHWFNEGTHARLYDKLGAHPVQHEGVSGTCFTVWAPNAEEVSVIGDFNGWRSGRHRLYRRGASGIWEGFVPGVYMGAAYKYHLRSQRGGYEVDKADPVGFRHETPPRTASQVWHLDYQWGDESWMRRRAGCQGLANPVSIYEVHLGSWLRDAADPERLLTYAELAPRLADHVQGLGFTHVELLPITEHPFYGSWGYQTTGYYAPTSRHGAPQDFMYLVDLLHQRGIGVILDWVPSHFPSDEHGLVYFDGTHLYEHADPRLGFHPDWKSYIFNYGRHEVRSFLISSALFWLDRYHIDGLRVDAVASMLYRDYSRPAGEWLPNRYGGNENLEAIEFLRALNEAVYRHHPGAHTIAEESTAWPMVSRPLYVGGLGFGYKWDMGWMHDTLKYLALDPVHRKYHHNQLTFRGLYAYTENYLLPLSHDEVVHGKGSLLGRLPGDDWQKFANLRLLLSYQWATPGKKLLFMGGEFGQWREWNHDAGLDWHLVQEGNRHDGIQRLIGMLNRLYREDPALHSGDADAAGFEWIDCQDAEQSTLIFLRRCPRSGGLLVAAFNFTPLPRLNTKIGVPRAGYWREVFNSDAAEYGGSGTGNFGGTNALPIGWHFRPHSLLVTLPPLGAVFFKPEADPA